MTEHTHNARRTHRDGRRHGRGNRAAFMAGRAFGERSRDRFPEANEAPEFNEGRARRSHRDGQHPGRGHRAAFMAGRNFGSHGHRHAGDRPRGAAAGTPGRGHLRGIVADLQMQIDDLERKMRRLKREARRQASTPDEQVEVHSSHKRVVRTNRVNTRADRHGRHGHEMGRKMGRITHRAWRDRRPEA